MTRWHAAPPCCVYEEFWEKKRPMSHCLHVGHSPSRAWPNTRDGSYCGPTIPIPFGEEAGPRILNRGTGLLTSSRCGLFLPELSSLVGAAAAGLFRRRTLSRRRFPSPGAGFSLGKSSVPSCQHGLPVHQPPQTTPAPAAWSGGARRLFLLSYFTH